MTSPGKQSPDRRNLRQTLVRVLLVVVTVGGVVFLFILPARTWIGQSRAISQATRQSTLLSRENSALTKRAAQLQSPSYVEQLARQQYGLVMPGDESYSILPPTATTTTVPPAPSDSNR